MKSKTEDFANWDWSTPLSDVIKPFLHSKGFGTSNWYERNRVSHFSATTPGGEQIQVRLRDCGAYAGGNTEDAAGYGITSKRKSRSAEQAIADYVRKHVGRGITHILAVSVHGPKIRAAALFPIESLCPLWSKQRDVFESEWLAGRTGRKRGLVTNSGIPSLWLIAERTEGARATAKALWDFPGVIALHRSSDSQEGEPSTNDTYDDLNAGSRDVGSDAPGVATGRRSFVKRDDEVRRRVRARALDGCEYCDAERTFSGFLDVHHVFGVERSDREWTCIALCPNCHREAHWSPQAVRINAELAQLAVARYEDSTGKRAPPVPKDLEKELRTIFGAL